MEIGGHKEKSGPMSDSGFAKYRSDRNFGEHLWWHLFKNGTRPGGSTIAQGAVWTRKEFAGVVGRHPRAVGNWLKNQNVPSDISRIEAGLFGDSGEYAGWRLDLRQAAHILGQRNSNTQATRSEEAPFPRVLGMPAQTTAFVAREAELERMREILSVDSSPGHARQVVIQGVGGVGKTALAVEYVKRFRSSYSNIWWCSAEDENILIGCLAERALIGGAIAAEMSNIRIAASLALSFIEQGNEPWLIIYDNVPDPLAIASLLPSAPARLIITSRFSDWSDIALSVELNVFPSNESVKFLERRAGRHDPKGARFLAERLGQLPLALDHAAMTCRRTRISFECFARDAEQLIALAPGGAAYPRSVFATFNLAINVLPQSARSLMFFLSFFASAPVPLKIMHSIFDKNFDRAESLMALTEVSLIQINSLPDGYDGINVHRLVQSVARAVLEKEKVPVETMQSVVSGLLSLVPTESLAEPASWPECARLVPHIIALHDRDFATASALKQFPQLLRVASEYLGWRAEFDEAETLARSSLRICWERCSALDAKTGILSKSAAELLKGRIDVQAFSGHALDPDSHTLIWDAALSLAELSRVLEAKGHLIESTEHSIRSAAITMLIFGKHRQTATALCWLANSFLNIRDTVNAQSMLEQARAFDEADDVKILIMTGLARVKMARQDFAGAKDDFQQILNVTIGLHGHRHLSSALAFAHLARAALSIGDASAALSLFQNTLSIKNDLLGSEHPDTNITLGEVGAALSYVGEHEQALTAISEAIKALSKSLGPEHASVINVKLYLAHALAAAERFEEARSVFEEVIFNRSKIFGPDDPRTKAAQAAFDKLQHL